MPSQFRLSGHNAASSFVTLVTSFRVHLENMRSAWKEAIRVLHPALEGWGVKFPEKSFTQVYDSTL